MFFGKRKKPHKNFHIFSYFENERILKMNAPAILYFVTEVEGEDIGELELEEEVVSLAESTGDNRTSSLTG